MPIDQEYLTRGRKVTDSPGSNISAFHWDPTPDTKDVVLRLLESRSLHRSKSKHKKHEGKKRSSSKSSHRTSFAVSKGLLEDERRFEQLEELLRIERLRTEDAVSRAEYAERREKTALAEVQRLEEAKVKLQEELVAIEAASRDYQVQLELTVRELRVSQRDAELLQHDATLVERRCKEAEEKCRKYQAALRKYEAKMSSQETEMQIGMQKSFFTGEGQGYDVGYDAGYREGRRDGKQHGIKSGRKEGLREGLEQGRAEERRNAVEAIDRFLAENNHGMDASGIRRWAQSVYYPQSQRDFSEVGSNPVAP